MSVVYTCADVMATCAQVLVGLYRAQLLPSRSDALEALNTCAEQLAASREGTQRLAHLRLHCALLRTLCLLEAGETGTFQKGDGTHSRTLLPRPGCHRHHVENSDADGVLWIAR